MSRLTYLALLFPLVTGFLVCFGVPAAVSEPLTIAEEGTVRQPVVVAEHASSTTRAAAEHLAEYLERMTGGNVPVRDDGSSDGLRVGVTGDFPDLNHGVSFDPEHPLRRDEYLIRTRTDGALLIGASDNAVRLAVWDVLHRLGYRLYFLTDTWEVVPDRPTLEVDLDTVKRPDFVTRRAPRGAPWSDDELWQRWKVRNRVTSSFQLRTGHAYGRIIRENKEAFRNHPEYYALVDGERRHSDRIDGRGNVKFCISNPDLRELVVDYAVQKFQEDPERDSISMDPSDGGNWCECDQCRALGSVSDRVVTLANEVAQAVNQLDLGPKYVGIYAYNYHSPPPEIEVHPNVIVSIATSFIKRGYTVEELVEGWQAQGATIGIREYHDVFAWHHDRPREARGGDIDYLRRRIPYFYEHGARFMNSENQDSWGSNGLGFWITPRLLWDVDAADRVDSLVDDFITRAFGAAKQPMQRFYRLLNDRKRPRSGEDIVAQLYRYLRDARRINDDPAVRRRLNDLLLYTRYLDLYYDYRLAEGDERQRKFEQVWRHTYRMRDRMMLSTRAICDREKFRDDSVSVPERAAWEVPERKNPWKSSEPFGEKELANILSTGIDSNEPTELEVDPVDFSDDLVPATPLDLREVKSGTFPTNFRGKQRFFTWLPDERKQFDLRVTGGLIEHYRDRGNVDISLYRGTGNTQVQVDHDESVPPDGRERRVTLTSDGSGLHVLEWDDGNDMTHVEFPEDLPFTLRLPLNESVNLRGRWSLWFYVPNGTETVAGYADQTSGQLLNDRGETVFSFSEMDRPGYFNVPVPEGQDGTVWQFKNCGGTRRLINVPPYLAPEPEQLLLPREVVEVDRSK